MSVLESYRKQKTPLWIGFSKSGFALFLRLPNGGVHLGAKFTRDRIPFAGKKESQYGFVLWFRRNRKGQAGIPHALTFKFFIS